MEIFRIEKHVTTFYRNVGIHIDVMGNGIAAGYDENPREFPDESLGRWWTGMHSRSNILIYDRDNRFTNRLGQWLNGQSVITKRSEQGLREAVEELDIDIIILETHSIVNDGRKFFERLAILEFDGFVIGISDEKGPRTEESSDFNTIVYTPLSGIALRHAIARLMAVDRFVRTVHETFSLLGSQKSPMGKDSIDDDQIEEDIEGYSRQLIEMAMEFGPAEFSTLYKRINTTVDPENKMKI